MSSTAKVTINQLAAILEVNRKTASKEYKVILDCVARPRKYLVQSDLTKWGL